MARAWNLLMIGTRIRVKSDKGNIDGTIIWYLAGQDKEIIGYLMKPDKAPDNKLLATLITVDLDGEFEVLGT
jgi:hypothetical protein